MREIKVEELKDYNHGRSTVGDLLDYINEELESGRLTRESIVLSQRVEDTYFENNNWGVVKKEGFQHSLCVNHNKRIDDGYYLDKEQFPNIRGDEEFLKKIPDDILEDAKDQYHPIWCPVIYNNDKNLYLDLHY